MKTKFKPFLAVMLGLMMPLVGISTAAAGTLNPDGLLVNEDGTDTIQAAITKVLQMPIGTAIPNAQFIYDVTPKSVDGDDTQTGIMPPLGTANTVTIDFPTGATAVTPALANGDDAYFIQSNDIFANVTATTFPHAGVYVYEITEQADTNPAIDADNNQELTYSQGKYTLTLLVANTPAGVTPAGTYIYGLATVYTTTDDGTPADEKVDPTPGSNGTYSEMAFTNTYVHTNGPVDPEDPETPPVDPGDPDNATLAVSKTVDGTLGDKTALFEFTATITPPTLQQNVPDAYRAYVVDSSGAVVTKDENGTIAGTDDFGAYLEITPADPTFTFKLMDGQKLVVVNAAVGSTYTVTEGASDHAPSVAVTTHDVNTTPATSSASARNALGTGSQHVGEPHNTVAYTNTRDLPILTGLTMNDLPFVGLIVLAVGALVAYIVVKTRKTHRRGKMAV